MDAHENISQQPPASEPAAAAHITDSATLSVASESSLVPAHLASSPMSGMATQISDAQEQQGVPMLQPPTPQQQQGVPMLQPPVPQEQQHCDQPLQLEKREEKEQPLPPQPVQQQVQQQQLQAPQHHPQSEQWPLALSPLGDDFPTQSAATAQPLMPLPPPKRSPPKSPPKQQQVPEQWPIMLTEQPPPPPPSAHHSSVFDTAIAAANAAAAADTLDPVGAATAAAVAAYAAQAAAMSSVPKTKPYQAKRAAALALAAEKAENERKAATAKTQTQRAAADSSSTLSSSTAKFAPTPPPPVRPSPSNKKSAAASNASLGDGVASTASPKTAVKQSVHLNEEELRQDTLRWLNEIHNTHGVPPLHVASDSGLSLAAFQAWVTGDAGWDRRLTHSLRSWVKRFLDAAQRNAPPTYPPPASTPAIGPPPPPPPPPSSAPPSSLLSPSESVSLLPPNIVLGQRIALPPPPSILNPSYSAAASYPSPQPLISKPPKSSTNAVASDAAAGRRVAPKRRVQSASSTTAAVAAAKKLAATYPGVVPVVVKDLQPDEDVDVYVSGFNSAFACGGAFSGKDSDGSDAIVAVRLEIDHETKTLRDNILWNTRDMSGGGVTPEVFARHLVGELDFPDTFVASISRSIRDAIEAKESRAPPCDLLSGTPEVYGISLDLRLNDITLQDQFLWDASNVNNSPESFARQMVADLGLPAEFVTAIAFSIREQIAESRGELWQIQQKLSNDDPGLYLMDVDFDRPFRSESEIERWAPTVLQLTKAELEVVDRQAAKRRRRGLNA